MFKRIALAIAIASSMSVVTVPAEAGPFRDKLKSAATKVLRKGFNVVACAEEVITNKRSILCTR